MQFPTIDDQIDEAVDRFCESIVQSIDGAGSESSAGEFAEKQDYLPRQAKPVQRRHEFGYSVLKHC